MQHPAAPVSPVPLGFRPKKRKLPFSPPSAKRRSPSYRRTQERNVDFLKLKKIVDGFLKADRISNRFASDGAHLSTLRDHLLEFVATQGRSLLQQMEHAKALVELVITQLEMAKIALNVIIGSSNESVITEILNLFACFPSTTEKMSYCHMGKAIDSFVKVYEKEQSSKRKANMDSCGEALVWGDDEFDE